jgi:voltage-gated potassium channel
MRTREESKMQTRLFNILFTDTNDDPIERQTNWFLTGLIFVSVLSVILETEAGLYARYQAIFWGFEIFTVAVFTIEYILRMWVCTMDPRYESPVLGRIKYALTPLALIDLASILPFYLPAAGMDLRFLRAIRLVRLFRLLKLGHYSQSMRTLGKVLRSRKEELLITLFAGFIVLIMASGVMYYVERDAQPDKFSSILNSMWWGTATLTTVGYGDIYPITPLGKIAGSIISVVGIGLFVLPAGILATGFLEELQSRKKVPQVCPHCGKEY